MTISGRTQIYGVVGDPVSHSLSPVIHNSWLQKHSIDAVYVPVRLSSSAAADDLRRMAKMGFKGLNVTLPHKLAAAQAAFERSNLVERIGAANTLVQKDDGHWIAHNTDIEGLDRALLSLNVTDLEGRPIVLIGAGGAARAASVALERLGATIRLVNRSPERAREMAEDLGLSPDIGGLSDLSMFSQDAALIVNSASFGHSSSVVLDLPPGEGRPFFDMSYGAAAHTVLQTASQAGWRAHDGLSMLVYQAAASFRLWFDIEPDAEDALSRCRSSISTEA